MGVVNVMELQRAIEVAIGWLDHGPEKDDCEDCQAAAKLRAALPFIKAAEATCKMWADADDQGVPRKDFTDIADAEDAMLDAYRAMKEAKT